MSLVCFNMYAPLVELVDTLVLEASAQASEFESRRGHQIWSRSINGDAVDCKSAVLDMPGSIPGYSTKLWKCGRVRFIAPVLKTDGPKGSKSSNLFASANLYLLKFNYTGSHELGAKSTNHQKCQEDKELNSLVRFQQRVPFTYP